MHSDFSDLSILIVGCGSIGRRHGRVLSSIGVRAFDICDPAEEARSRMKSEIHVGNEFSELSAALEKNPHAVLICTPSSLHIPQAIQSLRSGAHVLCEKPLSNSLERVHELEDVIAQTKRKFMTAFCFRYHEGLMMAKRMVDEGKIGRLAAARFRFSENLAEVRPDYKTLFTVKEGGVYDLTHEIDLAFWFCKGNAKRIHAMSSVVSDLGFTAPDIVSLAIEFDDPMIAQIYLDYFSYPRTRLTELMGTEGTITVEFASWNSCTVSLYNRGSNTWERTILVTERNAMFRKEDERFLRATLDGTPVDIPFEDSLKSLAIIAGDISR